MINFHKSPSPDSTGTFETKSILIKLEIINSNVLYLTHEVDQIKIIAQKINNTVNLKQQSLDYYGNEPTSPQTEPNEQ